MCTSAACAGLSISTTRSFGRTSEAAPRLELLERTHGTMRTRVLSTPRCRRRTDSSTGSPRGHGCQRLPMGRRAVTARQAKRRRPQTSAGAGQCLAASG
jgi:hypothetical protein